MDLGISGKKVLVTGASRGLGRAIAIDFAKEGCRVCVISRRADYLRTLVEEMGGASKGHAYFEADLMEAGAGERAVNALSTKADPFEIVVHNVGGTIDIRDPLSSVSDWNKVWQFNVGIAIDINRLVVPPMQVKNWGRIIHISSISAEWITGSIPYSAAKAYLNAYSKGLGQAVAKDGIVVSALMPGAFTSEGGHWDRKRKTNPEQVDDFLRHHQALGRLGTPEEISPFALFMASKYATFAAASFIPIDGGTTRS